MDEIVLINRNPHEPAFGLATAPPHTAPTGFSIEPATPPPILGHVLDHRHFAVWKTCLRQVAFTSLENLPRLKLLSSDQIFTADAATAFLISILCGLQSPVFGETEVFGQFKVFVDGEKNRANHLFPPHSKWLKFVIETVKEIRTRYVVGMGSNSYGSTIRKLTRDVSNITIIGAGQLATEILPWIAKNKKISVCLRNKDTAFKKYAHLQESYPGLQFTYLTEQVAFEACLIIAAPIDHEDLTNLIQNSTRRPQFIYDLRNSGFEELRREIRNIKMLSLSDFFATFNEDKIKFEVRKKEIETLIQLKCREFNFRSDVRPLGWDDLCL